MRKYSQGNNLKKKLKSKPTMDRDGICTPITDIGRKRAVQNQNVVNFI